MKGLNRLYLECAEELKRINMDVSNRIISVSTNGRLRTTLGICHYDYRTGNYRIEINPALLADNVDELETKDTIIHEMLHTCPGCMTHGWEWKRRADRVNRMLGYHVSRTASRKEMEAAGVEVKREEFKYALECVECGNRCKYKRWCSTLENPSRYRCAKCHGDFRVISLDKNREIWGLKAANRAE